MKAAKLFLALIVVSSLVLAACGATPTPTPVVVTKVETKVVVQTQIVEKPVEKVVEKVVTATPVPPTPVPTKPPAKLADTVVLALQQEPDTMHPLIGAMMARSIIASAFQIGCMGQNEKVEWIPLGCETVPTLENGGAKFVGEGVDKHLEVTYKIKAGWRWTDGTPVTTKDVLSYYKLVMDPEMEVAGRSTTEKIFDIKVIDASSWTAVFMSEKQAKAAAAGTLTGYVNFAKFKDDYVQSGYADQKGAVVDPVYWYAGAGWQPAHIVDKTPAKDQAKSEYARKPLGDGPYVVKEWKQGQELVLELSDKPFLLGTPKVKTIVWRFISETAGVIAALQKGEIDAVTGTGGLTVASAPDLDKIEAAGLYKVLYEPGYQWEHIDINTTKFPLDDIKVRKALYHATDRQTLVNRLYFGKQKTTDLPVPPGLSWAYSTDYVKYPFDVAKAKALLTEAGWDCKALPCTKKVGADTKTADINLMTTDRADRQALAQVIQAQWKAVNFGVNIQFLYGRGLFATCSAGGPLSCRTFDAAIYTWITGDDPGHIGQYDCAGIPTKENNWSGQNYPGWCNKKADELLAKNELDPEISLSIPKRKPVLAEFYKIWTDEIPVIPLFSNTRVYVIRAGWKNWKAGPTQYAADAWNVWEWEVSK